MEPCEDGVSVEPPEPLRQQRISGTVCCQVEEAAGKLAHFKFQRIVVSPFQRCLETAKLMTELLNLPPSRWQVDTAVCEVCCYHVRVEPFGR